MSEEMLHLPEPTRRPGQATGASRENRANDATGAKRGTHSKQDTNGATRAARDTQAQPTATKAQWFEASRPHTWANAVAPVVAGTASAILWGGFDLFRAILALIVAVALIIGVNYANDYSDGIRGTDDNRTGPFRITASGLVEPAMVKRAAFISFGVAAAAGLLLALLSSWWLIPLGAVCILAAWWYTGGKKPYGYLGFGEIAVFVFFGLVAVLGTEFTQSGAISGTGVAMAVAIGSLSASVMLVNNIRDIPTDQEAGKRTLAVRLGDDLARRLFLSLQIVALAMTFAVASFYLPALLGLVAVPFLVKAIRPVLQGATGKDLIPVLGLTGRGMLVWAVANLVGALFGVIAF